LASDHHLGSKRSIRCSVSDSAIYHSPRRRTITHSEEKFGKKLAEVAILIN
jgi:hypothetical protein